MSLCGKTEEDVFVAAAAGLEVPGVTMFPEEVLGSKGMYYCGASKRRKRRMKKYKKPHMHIQYELFAPCDY